MTSSEQLSRENLKQFEVFHDVSMDPVWELLSQCEVRTLGDGETLLEKDHSNCTMFFVLSGILKVYLDDEFQRVAAELRQGQTVGELSVIDGSVASANVVSSGVTSLLCVEEETFWDLTRTSHGFCANLLMLLSLRMRSSNVSLEESENLQVKFEQQAITDGLTGAYNRRWLDQMLPRLLQRSEGDDLPFCVVMIDVDYFKKFNDNFGHAVGDDALRIVAETLLGNARPTDLVVRYGGEEFCLLLPETDLQSGIGAAERTRKAIQQVEICDANGKPAGPITISAGLAEHKASESAEELLRRADQALYIAKSQGRDRVEAST